MTQFVVIRLSGVADPVEWVHVDSEGTRQSGVSSGTLADAAREARDDAVIVLVPATDVLTTSVKIPVRSTSKIRAALPFALEELVAEDVDVLHFASGGRREDDRIPVAVVAHEKMRAWIEQLAAAGIEPARVIAESHGLATIPGTMSLLIDDHCIMFNDGADSEFVMQDVKPSDLLVAAGKLETGASNEDAAADSGHLLAFCAPEHDRTFSHDWNALRHELHSVDINLLPDGVLPKLAVTVASGHGVNLLQGPYGKKSGYSSYLRPWKAAAALLLAFFLLAFASRGVDYYRLAGEQSALREQFNAEYQLLRPGTREVLDPVSTVESLRRSLGKSDSPQVFLPSLNALGAALEANSAADIEAISYRAGVIDIRLSAPDIATLDSIQQAVSSSGRFQASIQSAEKVADRINGRIQIREPGS